ncbi:MAG: helix-turn-helix domain-containing protein [Hyphomicrobium sp.]|uniref:helix-turn-helix domain-containing protein n=1 Tax=Hyphomicrobium sp. TaxID=82 RepID=UPI003D12E028
MTTDLCLPPRHTSAPLPRREIPTRRWVRDVELIAILGPPLARVPLVSEILRAVSAASEVSVAEIVSDRRHRIFVMPRHIAMWIAFHATTRSLPEIGRRIGKRDHTSVLHAIGSVSGRLSDPMQGEAIAELIGAALAHLAGVAAGIPSARAPIDARSLIPDQPAPLPLPLPTERIEDLRTRDKRSVRGIAWLLGLPPAAVAEHLGLKGTFDKQPINGARPVPHDAEPRCRSGVSGGAALAPGRVAPGPSAESEVPA